MIEPPTPHADERIAEQAPANERRRALRRTLVLVSALVAMAAAWQWTPLGELISPRALAELGEPLRGTALAPLLALALFLAGSLLVIPVTLLVLQASLLFGPAWGLVYSCFGVAAGAALTYALGRALGRDAVKRLMGDRVRAVVSHLQRSSVLAIAAVRTVPLAPFTIVNVVAGALRIPFGPFVVGTTLGALPGALAINLFGGSLLNAAREATPQNVVGALAVGLAVVLAGMTVRRLFMRRAVIAAPRTGPRA